MADDGLREDNQLLSQIPTYVVAVPTGKEKVSVCSSQFYSH